MPVKAQDLCNELFREIEGAMSDAWISDDAGTDDPAEFLKHVQCSMWAMDEAKAIIKRFLRKHKDHMRKTT